MSYTNEERAAEIKKEIKALQDELKSMSIPPLTELVKAKPYDSRLHVVKRANYSDAWDDLTKLAKRIWRNRGQNVPQLKDLSKEQLELSADFLNEVIPIYNRYFEQARGIKK